MKKRTVFVIGFIAGIAIGAFVSGSTATINAFVTLPLKWLTEDLHPFPSESLVNLILAWPLWFVYWGCLGALFGLLLRVAFRVFLKPEQTRPDIPKQSPSSSQAE